MPRLLKILSFLTALVVLISLGCGPPSSGGAGQSGSSGSSEIPDITDDIIRERINTTWIRGVPPEDGVSGEPIFWRFRESEPKEITLVDKQMDGPRATIILDISTKSSPRSREQRQLAGRIRTVWELQTGWALRTWEIVETENISMKYKNLPKPPEQNSNEAGHKN